MRKKQHRRGGGGAFDGFARGRRRGRRRGAPLLKLRQQPLRALDLPDNRCAAPAKLSTLTLSSAQITQLRRLRSAESFLFLAFVFFLRLELIRET